MPIARPLLAAALFCTLPLSYPLSAAEPREAVSSAALAAPADSYYESQARFDPVYSATFFGDNRFDDQLPIQRQLTAIDRRRLSGSEALTYDLLARELGTRIGFEKFDDHLLPLQQMDAIPIVLANFGGGQAEQPLKTVAQYDTCLKRIARLPAWAVDRRSAIGITSSRARESRHA